MGQTARIYSNEYAAGTEEQRYTAKKNGGVSGAKAVLTVLLLNIVVAMAIGMIVGEIVLSDIKLPAMFGFF